MIISDKVKALSPDELKQAVKLHLQNIKIGETPNARKIVLTEFPEPRKDGTTKSLKYENTIHDQNKVTHVYLHRLTSETVEEIYIKDPETGYVTKAKRTT